MKLVWGKVGFTVFSIAAGGVVAYFAQPLIHNNDQALNVIVTVFSVLSGFLVAIIAVVGDPMLLTPGSWRAAELGSELVDRRLCRHKYLFYIYLITLGLIFTSSLFTDSTGSCCIWIERLFLFFAVVAFLFSLKLPSSLMKIQQERIEAEIKHRRTEAGIKND